MRHPEILRLARSDGKVTVEGLAAQFGVTLQTIRRDLSDLAQAGQLARVHGGAVLPSGTVNIAYEERRALQADAKTAIARACAAEIPGDVCLFLNIGTTTEAVARELLHHRGLLVVTNNLNVARILSANPACEVIVTGGSLRPADGGLVGPVAVAGLGRFRFDLAVIGCSALSPAGDLLDYDLSEVEVSRAALDGAGRSILVADLSKLERAAPARIAPLSRLGTWVTEAPPPPHLAAECAGWGTEVIVA